MLVEEVVGKETCGGKDINGIGCLTVKGGEEVRVKCDKGL